MKSIKLGKYIVRFGIEKNPPKRETMPEIISRTLEEHDKAIKNNQLIRSNSLKQAEKYESLRKRSFRISYGPETTIKTKTIIEKEFTPQDVYKQMIEIVNTKEPDDII